MPYQLDTGTRRPTTSIAVTPHHLASEAAVAIMRNGGNALDAAIAANAIVGVVLPDTCGIGGDLFALIHSPGDTAPKALNASGMAGSGMLAADLRAAGEVEVPLKSLWSVTVPGCVDGWEALTTAYGSVSLAEMLAPAIDLASSGFGVSQELAASLDRLHPLIGDQGSAPALYPNGKPPLAGSVIRRPRLAATLRGIAASGGAFFYHGDAGQAITAVTEGRITAADLATDQAEWIEPLGLDVYGRQAWTIPPNSQGYATLAASWIFEQLAPPRDANDPAFVHALVEAYRAVAWELADLVTDPATAPIDPKQLVDPDRLRPMAASISPDRITRFPAPTGRGGGTTYLCTRDATGMGVSLIQSNFHGIGSGLSAGDTGVFLHNRGAGFTLEEGHPNELTPGRRPFHTLSPTLWTRDGALDLILGTRGGEYQPQLLIQVAANFFWAGLEPDSAQRQTRWVLDGFAEGEDPRLVIEERAEDHTVAGLVDRGHAVASAGPWETGWGPVSMISVQEPGVRGAADPRVSTVMAAAGS